MNTGQRVKAVLEEIPYDRLVGADEISTKTGISSHKVAGIIKSHLLNKYVERTRIRTEFGKKFGYKRIRFVKAKTVP